MERYIQYQAVLLDGDGVLWRSNDPIPGINAFFTFLEEEGIDLGPGPGGVERLVPEQEASRIVQYEYKDVGAAPASGSNPYTAYLIVPCSTGTLGRIASGVSDSLMTRMADVALKERRPLILVPRETPLSLIHLENLTRLARAGATILPASPGFYHGRQSTEQLLDFIVDRIFEHIDLPVTSARRWMGGGVSNK
jgi:4-hydroxy-3-polyprenylbenzoate decarboxylase